MTAALALRPPLVTRVFAVAWGLAVTLSMVANFRPENGGSWVGTIVISSSAAFIAWRLFRHGVFGTADGRLVIRNLWRTTTVHRDDIAEVLGARVRRSGWAVHLRLRTGDFVRLDVTQVPLRGLLRRRLERHEAAVREWMTGRPHPFL
jgi:hypothetical protein